MHNEIAEDGVWLLWVADADCELVSELGAEDRVEIAFHLALWGLPSAGFKQIFDFIFRCRHSHGYLFKVGRL